ncbi:MAG: SDR family oxidoreductase [Paramuribaculum sp.]|nr:SDR family oxidoreductase [Paramuribaculum sp.]
MDDSLKDKVAFVTGATAGIGLACVRELASRGAKVTVASRNKEHVDATVDKLLKEGFDVRGAILDASDIPSCTNAVVDTIRAMGRIDIVVNNAGGTNLSRDTAVENLDLDFFRDVMDLNVLSTLAVIKAALPSMIARKSGAIVNIASIGGITGDFRDTLYGIAKAGIINLTKYVATQYGKEGIRCNAVAPGIVMTGAVTENLSEAVRKIFLEQNALDTLGQPEDIAATVAFLAGEGSRYITGQTIVADGGMTCHNPTIAQIRALYAGK